MSLLLLRALRPRLARGLSGASLARVGPARPLCPAAWTAHCPLSTSCWAWQRPSPSPSPPSAADLDASEQEIYRGILSTQIRLVKAFSLMTSVIGLSVQPVLYFHAQSAGQHVGIFLAAGAFFSFFTFATPLLIHFVSKKYVTEMHYNRLEDTYTAKTYSLLLRKKEIKFRVQDVNVPDIPGMFTTFKAKDVPLFVDGQQFFAPQHYVKIMGYDKPLNLRRRTRKEPEQEPGQGQ